MSDVARDVLVVICIVFILLAFIGNYTREYNKAVAVQEAEKTASVAQHPSTQSTTTGPSATAALQPQQQGVQTQPTALQPQQGMPQSTTLQPQQNVQTQPTTAASLPSAIATPGPSPSSEDEQAWVARVNAELEHQRQVVSSSPPCDLVLGMTEGRVLDCLGAPNHVNRSVGSWGVHEQWVYGSYTWYSSLTYLYFENGILTSWSD